MQLAPARYGKLIGRIGVFHPQRDIRLQFFHQALAQLARRGPLALAARQRRRVDSEGHPQGRLIHLHNRQRDGVLARRDGLADVHVRQARNRDNLARLRLLHFGPVQPLVDKHLGDLAGDVDVLSVHHNDVLAGLHDPRIDPPDGDTAFVIVVIQRRRPKLKRRFRVAGRRVQMVHNGLEQDA